MSFKIIGFILINLIYLEPLIFTRPIRSDSINKLIKNACLEAFYLEMEEAGPSPPEKMGDYACKCFIKKIRTGLAFDSAQAVCKEETNKAFNL